MDKNKNKADSQKTINIAFLGDISLNDRYVELYKKRNNPFKEIEPELKKADYVIGNLESMAKGEEGENLLKSPRLNTTVETLNYLKKIHLSVATLAHNHVYDHLLDGFLKTTGKLKELGVQFLGAGTTKDDATEPLILSQNGITIGLLNYVTEDTHPNLPDIAKVHLNFFNEKTAIRDIAVLKHKVDHIVLLMHWGGKVEGGYYPDWEQPKLAKKLVDAGADLIIGHHPHTLQPFDIHNDKYIFYSLGNFCFADFRTDGKKVEIEQGRNTETAWLDVCFGKNGYELKSHLFDNSNFASGQLNKIRKKWVRRNRNFKYISKVRLVWLSYFFKLKKINPVIFYFWGNDRSFVGQLKHLKMNRVKGYLSKLIG